MTRVSRRVAKRRSSISRGRKAFYKKYKSYRSMAYTAYKGVRMLKGLVNVERKFADTQVVGNIVDTGSITLLNPVSAGNDANQRSGNSILGKYLTIRMTATCEPTATTTYLRVIILMDLNGQGVAPTLASILQDITIGDGINSAKNIDNTDRFWILKDKVIPLDIADSRTAVRKWYIPLNTHLKYSGTNATDVDTNAIYAVMLSDQGTGTYEPYVNFYCRLAFYDN